MKNPLNKILIALVLLILIPVGIVSVFEISKLNENEELINTVYKNQLESIVTSINSYTQDLVSNWASRIELAVKHETFSNSTILNRLRNENQTIKSIFITNEIQGIKEIFKLENAQSSPSIIAQILLTHQKEIKQLKSYFLTNYRKIETFNIDETTSLVYFIIEEINGSQAVCFIELDQKDFLQNQVSSRLQSIAQDNIIINLSRTNTQETLLSTQRDSIQPTNYDFEGNLWLFPNVSIQVSLKNQTISALAKQRAREATMLFAFVFLFLIGGIWFLYSSIKRELQLAQIKSEFISNVSHEIRTPLSLISMYIETLEMGRIKSAEKVMEYYQIINKETQRLIGIVNTILNFSKMEKGKRVFNFKECNLNNITYNLLETYESHFNLKEFDYTFLPAENIPAIQCDSEAIAEAIINLIENAIKYSEGNKRIEIKTGVDKKYTFIEVKDFGIGISKKHQKLIFDKFYRVTHDNLANKTKGTGLGLSIVNEIVKTHKGKITLHSKIDEGSAFRLYFPIYQNNTKR